MIDPYSPGPNVVWSHRADLHDERKTKGSVCFQGLPVLFPNLERRPAITFVRCEMRRTGLERPIVYAAIQ